MNKTTFIEAIILYLFLIQSASAIQITGDVEFQTNDTNATFIMGGNLTFDRIEVHSTYLKLDNNTISATPSVGSVNITIINFTDAYKKWNETADSGTTVSHVISNFTASTQILVKKDSVAWTGLTSNSTGYISFTYSGSYPITFEVEAGTMPTTITTTPSAGGGYPTYKPTQEQLEEGYEKSLRKNWEIQFEFNNETHTIKLDNIINKTAMISVSSKPITFNLTVNETQKLNLDNDTYYDLEIFLKDISDYEADLVVKLIHEEIPCEPNWDCSEWSECADGKQTRICTDLNSCNTIEGKPDEIRECCEPDWECSEWSECVNNIQTRSCTDLHNCNITEGRPDEVRECEAQTGYLNILIVSGLIVAVAALGFVVRKQVCLKAKVK